MRLIGTFRDPEIANRFGAFLESEGIHCRVENNQIWVHDEDALAKAKQLLAEFADNPPAVPEPRISAPIESSLHMIQPRPNPVTLLFLLLSVLVFLWNLLQQKQSPASLTPIAEALFYDTDPNWKGVYVWTLLKLAHQNTELALGPLFSQIRQGEWWRLFSPAILHRDFLHLLFNMMWLWMLGRPIEARIGPFRTLALTLLLGALSNTAQYLMSGPFFLGYSGIVLGLAGFTWMREKIAPWEGYPLQKSTVLFLAIYVLALVGLQLSSFFFLLFTEIQFNPNIANTAHLAGALAGILLGRLSLFQARFRKS